MKKLIFLPFFILLVLPVYPQSKRTEILSKPENENRPAQGTGIIAILKSSSRLFAEKDDLTSVILVIPSGDTVGVVTADSTYLKVEYRGNNGYIFSKHALVKSPPSTAIVKSHPEKTSDKYSTVADDQSGRYESLIYKYGKSLADKLIEGKIWKGMDTEMVKDSWGNALRINRVIKGNSVTEEWIYRTTWLYFENGILYQWGPAGN